MKRPIEAVLTAILLFQGCGQEAKERYKHEGTTGVTGRVGSGSDTGNGGGNGGGGTDGGDPAPDTPIDVDKDCIFASSQRFFSVEEETVSLDGSDAQCDVAIDKRVEVSIATETTTKITLCTWTSLEGPQDMQSFVINLKMVGIDDETDCRFNCMSHGTRLDDIEMPDAPTYLGTFDYASTEPDGVHTVDYFIRNFEKRPFKFVIENLHPLDPACPIAEAN